MNKDFMIISQAFGNLMLIGIIAWQWRKLILSRWESKALLASTTVLFRERSDAYKRCDEARAHIELLNTQLQMVTVRYVFKWNRMKDPKQPYSMLVIAANEDVARYQARALYAARRQHVRYPNVAAISAEAARREAQALFSETPEVVVLDNTLAAAYILNLPEG